MTIEQPPELKIDRLLQSGKTPHGQLERRIIWNLLLHLEAHGFTIFAVDDGDEVTKVGSKIDAMEEVFNLDEAELMFAQYLNSPRRWVKLTLGEGEDVICDWNAPRNDSRWNAAMDSFNPEDYL